MSSKFPSLRSLAFSLTLAFLAPAAGPAADLESALTTLGKVGPEGQGNETATQAWAAIAAVPADQLPRLLGAMNTANDRSRNYLFAAAAAIADRQITSGATLPLAALGDFLLDTRNEGRARRLAYELLRRGDPAAAEALLPGLLDDPTSDLRREAVQRLVDNAAKTLADGRKDAAAVLYRQAIDFARDADQIETIAKPLKDLGRPIDLVQHLGFLTTWKVIGPFDNTANAGYPKVFPPETERVFDAVYDGKDGKVRWTDFTTTHEMGMVDLNKAWAPLKEVTGYATTVFNSDVARPAEIRIGCKNGWKLWFNGQFIFGRDEYHRGAEIDQYRFPVELKAGPNTLLVKVTQNEQKEDWTVEWEFQLRLTDPTGKVLRSAPPQARVAALTPSTRLP
ncbi:MAG: HEAT repeat domain-containing protein [Verrucomicrobiales bacterium]|nr:HEAT repeat domain-containing protein [Verrucomicrobiales bacterium]